MQNFGQDKVSATGCHHHHAKIDQEQNLHKLKSSMAIESINHKQHIPASNIM